MVPTDADLRQRALAGDVDAFNEFVRRVEQRARHEVFVREREMFKQCIHSCRQTILLFAKSGGR